LFLSFCGSSTAVAITEGRVAAEGSSVLMHAPEVKDISFTEWKYIRDTTSEFIVQYYADSNSTTIYSPYYGRVTFYTRNGSILLQGLRETDSGTYRATVNLMQDKARTTHLEVIKPVPKPELQCRSNLAGSDIELVCVVPAGPEVSISWQKDGHPLPTKMRYLFSGGDTMLQIRNGDKLDCGVYSCNISNAISWEEATLNLMVTGLAPPLHHAQRVVVVVLSLIAASTLSFITQLHQMKERVLAKEVMKCIRLFTYGLLCISSLLLLVTSIIWMEEEGYRVIQNSTAPTTLIFNLFFATFFYYNIQRLHERGCSEAVDLTTSIGFAAVPIIALLLLILFHLW
ncbi:NCAM1 protein, partial [Zapornia atra]|nr:NCAM1 protein [Zapornia atra]